MGMFAFKAFLLYHYSRSQYHVCSLYFFDYFCSSYLPFARPDLLVWIALNVNTYLDYVTDTCLKIGLTVGNTDSLSLIQNLTHLIAHNLKCIYGTWLWLGILHNKLEYDLALTFIAIRHISKFFSGVIIQTFLLNLTSSKSKFVWLAAQQELAKFHGPKSALLLLLQIIADIKAKF